MTLLLEIVREAGLRAPKSISHTSALWGRSVIGETCATAGIIACSTSHRPRRPTHRHPGSPGAV